MDNISKKVFINPIFSGREVIRQVLLPESKEYEVDIINFGKGVRKKFHVHDYEQILQVAFRNCRSPTTTMKKEWGRKTFTLLTECLSGCCGTMNGECRICSPGSDTVCFHDPATPHRLVQIYQRPEENPLCFCLR